MSEFFIICYDCSELLTEHVQLIDFVMVNINSIQFNKTQCVVIIISYLPQNKIYEGVVETQSYLKIE